MHLSEKQPDHPWAERDFSSAGGAPLQVSPVHNLGARMVGYASRSDDTHLGTRN
jgi:hypothetical protein